MSAVDPMAWRIRQAELDATEDVEAAMDAAAERKWCRQLVTHANACLYYAANSCSHRVAREQVADAADALHAAGRLAPIELSAPLFRLRARLEAALVAAIGHPSGGELEAVGAEAETIRAALIDTPPPPPRARFRAHDWIALLILVAATYTALLLT